MVFSVNQLLTICWPITDLTPGGVPLSYMFKLYRYVLPQRAWSLVPFRSEMGIDFAHFGLELGVVFEGTVEVYEHIHCLNSKRIREKD